MSNSLNYLQCHPKQDKSEPYWGLFKGAYSQDSSFRMALLESDLSSLWDCYWKKSDKEEFNFLIAGLTTNMHNKLMHQMFVAVAESDVVFGGGGYTHSR